MLERDQPERTADRTEGVDVTLAWRAPIDELDAQLKAAIGRTDEIALIDSQPLIEQVDLRDRRLADADGTDRIGFDEADGDERTGEAGQSRCRHPAGGSPADDDELADPLAVHLSRLIPDPPRTEAGTFAR